jgi:hypothetical protein
MRRPARRRVMRGKGLWACAGVTLLCGAALWLAWAWAAPQLAQSLTLHPDALLPQRDTASPAADRAPQPPPCPPR